LRKSIQLLTGTARISWTVMFCSSAEFPITIPSGMRILFWFQYKWQRYVLMRENNGFSLQEDTDFNCSTDYQYADRMAGTIIRENGIMILPTQESTEIEYGINLYLNDFSGRNIADMPVMKKVTVENIILPDVRQKDLIGVHSYALSEEYEVVDMRYFRFSPRSRMRRILNKGKEILCTLRSFSC